jgi:hypothetical protein
MAGESCTREKSLPSHSESLPLKFAKKERSASRGGEASFSFKTVGLVPPFGILLLWWEEVDSAFDR